MTLRLFLLLGVIMLEEIFDITKKDIQSLTSEKLPELIGRLCEADLSSANLNTANVGYGGNISSSDSGVDVFVKLDNDPPSSSNIPKSTTVFQAKAQLMRPSDIAKEMEKVINNTSVFQELADSGGAYVIVSSKEDLAYRQRNNRIEEMKAILEENGFGTVHYSFIDSQQLASWVRQHPSITILVKNWLGRSFSGWKPYGDWTEVQNDESRIFKIDEKPRFYFFNEKNNNSNDPVSTIEAIERVRSDLRLPGRAIRLVGLSGVGKTRFAQALFDQTIGQDALDSFKVVYAENFSSVSPSPLTMLENLIAQNFSGVVIVDNCSSDNHAELVKLILNSNISLLTIEYDVSEDIPETTEVVLMNPSSEDHLVEILRLRYPKLPLESLRAVAQQTDGNPRLAIYIAERLNDIGYIPPLLSENLYTMLFWQGNAVYPELERTARAVSLLYSYKGDLNTPDNEINLICKLSGQDKTLVLESLVLLENRKLIQSRGYWRALLPHVLSNRLAQEKIKTLSVEDVVDCFFNDEGARAFTSFCHRLSYLGNSENAKEIAHAFLTEGGIFWETGVKLRYQWRKTPQYLMLLDLKAGYLYTKKILNDYLTDPELNRWIGEISWIEELLRTLCYFPEYFSDSLEMLETLEKFELKLSAGKNQNYKKGEGFFQPLLSMTLADMKTKAEAIESRLRSDDESKVKKGLAYLRKALTTHDCFASWFPHLGSNQVNYGPRPSSTEEWVKWYSTFFQLGVDAYQDTNCLEINKVLADSFHDLWKTGLIDDLLSDWILSQQNTDNHIYCWRIILNSIRRTKDKGDNNRLEKLESLSTALSPKTDIQKAKFILACNRGYALVYFDDLLLKNGREEGSEKYNEELFKLGRQFGKEPYNLCEISDELFDGNNWYIHMFIKGLVSGSEDIEQTWICLINAFEKCKKSDKDLSVFYYLIKEISKHDKLLTEKCVLAVKRHKNLRIIYPLIKLPYLYTEKQVDVLITWMLDNKINPWFLINLTSINVEEEMIQSCFVYLLHRLITYPESVPIVIYILSLKIVNVKENEILLEELLILGQDMMDYIINNPNIDLKQQEYECFVILLELTKTEYPGKKIPSIIKAALTLFEKMELDSSHECFSAIAEKYPQQLLQMTFDFVMSKDYLNDFGLRYHPEYIGAILYSIDFNIVIDWCNADKIQRTPFIARFYTMINVESDKEKLTWRPFGRYFISQYHKIPNVLENILFRLTPKDWYGERTITFNDLIPLFDDPLFLENDVLKKWAEDSKKVFIKEIENENRANDEFIKNQNTFE